jgi:hypothetical protein
MCMSELNKANTLRVTLFYGKHRALLSTKSLENSQHKPITIDIWTYTHHAPYYVSDLAFSVFQEHLSRS